MQFQVIFDRFLQIFKNFIRVKKTPIIFGQQMAKIQLTKVSKYSFGDFVSPVCQYLDSLLSGFFFFYGIQNFLHKNGNFEQNCQFRYLTASISHPNFLFLVDMCIQLWEKQRMVYNNQFVATSAAFGQPLEENWKNAAHFYRPSFLRFLSEKNYFLTLY